VDLPGAEDDASGSAAVLEMARIFNQYGSPNTAMFMFYSGEEQGLYHAPFFSLPPSTLIFPLLLPRFRLQIAYAEARPTHKPLWIKEMPLKSF
jgi:hypothetical protein